MTSEIEDKVHENGVILSNPAEKSHCIRTENRLDLAVHRLMELIRSVWSGSVEKPNWSGLQRVEKTVNRLSLTTL